MNTMTNPHRPNRGILPSERHPLAAWPCCNEECFIQARAAVRPRSTSPRLDSTARRQRNQERRRRSGGRHIARRDRRRAERDPDLEIQAAARMLLDLNERERLGDRYWATDAGVRELHRRAQVNRARMAEMERQRRDPDAVIPERQTEEPLLPDLGPLNAVGARGIEMGFRDASLLEYVWQRGIVDRWRGGGVSTAVTPASAPAGDVAVAGPAPAVGEEEMPALEPIASLPGADAVAENAELPDAGQLDAVGAGNAGDAAAEEAEDDSDYMSPVELDSDDEEEL